MSTSYLITGATGALGRAAMAALARLEPAASIACLARPAADAGALTRPGVSVRLGDYDDPASLRAALAGVERLLLVSSPVLDPVVRARQHRAVLDAAAAAGVGFVVYTSALGAEHDPGHHLTEQALQAGPIPCTILRNGLYTEPFVAAAWQDALTDGVVRSATGGAPMRTASREDLALAAAHAVAHPAPGVVALNGPAWTYDALAASIGDRLGRAVASVTVPDAELGAVGMVHGLFRAGLLADPPTDLAALLGRDPLTADEVLARIAD